MGIESRGDALPVDSLWGTHTFMQWGGGGKKKDRQQQQKQQPQSCPAAAAPPSALHPTTTPKTAQPLAYAEDFLVPLPLPVDGPFSAAGLLSIPRKGAFALALCACQVSIIPRSIEPPTSPFCITVHTGTRTSPAGAVNLLAVAPEKGSVMYIYDLAGALLAEYSTGHAAPVTCIAFDGGGGGNGALMSEIGPHIGRLLSILDDLVTHVRNSAPPPDGRAGRLRAPPRGNLVAPRRHRRRRWRKRGHASSSTSGGGGVHVG